MRFSFFIGRSKVLTLMAMTCLCCCSVAQAAVSLTLPDNEWRLISLPASNLRGDATVDVFSEVLTADSYGTDGDWALFSFNDQTNAYAMVAGSDRLRAGVGYWMIQLTGSDITVELHDNAHPFAMQASEACATLSGCVEVPLHNSTAASAWGLYGYPESSPQLLSDTRIRTGSGACSSGCSPADAQSAGVFGERLYRYDGVRYQEVTGSGTLNAGEAYWIARPANTPNPPAQWLIPAVTSVKVAFTADQSILPSAEDVLRMIALEDTDLLMLQGDLGYEPNTADIWNQQLNEHLGTDFPVLSVIGNHEDYEWPIYKNHISSRINRVKGLRCSGDAGEKSMCYFRGLQVVQVAVGITEVPGVKAEDAYPAFIRQAFQNSPARWRICSWHKTQRLMQTGNNRNETGWEVYQECLDNGALVATAHQHGYSRTHLMTDFEAQTVKHQNSTLEVKPGQSFAFVSGLGGDSVRSQERGGEWWASIYTADQDATYGALFCTFTGLTANCYFKAIDGAVPDRFDLVSQHSPRPL